MKESLLIVLACLTAILLLSCTDGKTEGGEAVTTYGSTVTSGDETSPVADSSDAAVQSESSFSPASSDDTVGTPETLPDVELPKISF